MARTHKRLRLAIRKNNSNISIASYTALLEAAATSNDALQILLEISGNLQYSSDDDLHEPIQKIMEHFHNEQESAVRVKILALMAEFAIETCTVDATAQIENIKTLLNSEQSSKVISQGLHSFYKIGLHQQLSNVILLKIVNIAKKKLTSHSHNVQRHALLLLGAFTSLHEAEKETLNLVGKYTDSQDARVRAQAFRSILTLGERGVLLTPSLYPRATESLKDDYECVRKEALQLVYELGIKHPEQ